MRKPTSSTSSATLSIHARRHLGTLLSRRAGPLLSSVVYSPKEVESRGSHFPIEMEYGLISMEMEYGFPCHFRKKEHNH